MSTLRTTGDGDAGNDSESASSDAGESEGDDAEGLAAGGEAGAAATSGGGMGDVMAKILGQKVDTRMQVCSSSFVLLSLFFFLCQVLLPSFFPRQF